MQNYSSWKRFVLGHFVKVLAQDTEAWAFALRHARERLQNDILHVEVRMTHHGSAKMVLLLFRFSDSIHLNFEW